MSVSYHNTNTGDVVTRDDPSPRLEALPNWVRVADGDPAPAPVDDGILARPRSAPAQPEPAAEPQPPAKTARKGG